MLLCSRVRGGCFDISPMIFVASDRNDDNFEENFRRGISHIRDDNPVFLDNFEKLFPI